MFKTSKLLHNVLFSMENKFVRNILHNCDLSDIRTLKRINKKKELVNKSMSTIPISQVEVAHKRRYTKFLNY